MQEDKDNKPPSSSSSLQAKKLNMATMKQLSLIREESLSYDTVDDAPSCYANPLLTPLVSGEESKGEAKTSNDDIIDSLVIQSNLRYNVSTSQKHSAIPTTHSTTPLLHSATHNVQQANSANESVEVSAPLLIVQQSSLDQSEQSLTASSSGSSHSSKPDNINEDLNNNNNTSDKSISENNSPAAFRKKSSLRRSLKDRREIFRPSFRRRCASENCELGLSDIEVLEQVHQSTVKRLSLPNMPNIRRSSMSSASSSSSILSREHKEIFDKLDKLDGQKEGLINKEVVKQYVETTTSPYKKRESMQMMRLLSEMDEDKDGYIDPTEFGNFVEKSHSGKRPEMSKLLDQLRRTALAEVYSFWPPPFFLLFLSIAQLSLFIYHAIHLSSTHGQTISWHEPAPQCSALIFNPYRRWEVWRYLTYSLVHSGVAHITLNLVMQLFVGLPLEMSHGSLRIGIVYMSGVLFGSLATSTFDQNMFLAGASGGVYSLIMAHLASLILNWKEDIIIIRDHWRSNRTRSATTGSVYRLLRLISVVIYSICDLTYAIYVRLSYTSTNIGYLAHLAGGIAGLMVGLVVLKNRKSEAWEKAVKLVTLFVTLTIVVLALVWNIKGDAIYQYYYNKNYFPEQDMERVHNCTYYG
eukprot:TRINITY_DN10248_c0_g1_i2.p1 TRINITY_DN10248_c0_g1~~TRINITY_DN10248_c0_g1_i2.p1  ORF type:complete len:637 (+),score=102.63 TRINITY_DN10248_c0_g1_i2:167-2077(+)